MRRKHLAPFLIAAGLLLIGCGAPASSPGSSSKSGTSSSQASYSPFTYTGSDRMQRLEAEAKKEGKVTLFTVLAGPVGAALADGFKKDYGIEMEIYRADASNLVTRATQEDQVGRGTADIINSGADSLLQLEEMNLLQPYYTPTANKVPAGLAIPASGEQVWGVSAQILFGGMAYNSDMVPAAAAPKKMDDLLNPALKGKMAITTTSTGVRWIGLVLKALGDAKGREFLSKLSGQQVQRTSISGAALMDLVGQGQVALSLNLFKDHAAQQQEKGAPVEWLPLDNTAVAFTSHIMIYRKAPHPNAAMLLANWLLEGNGRKVLEENHYASATDKQPFDLWVAEAGMTTADQWAKSFETWQQLFDQTFGK